MFIKISLWSRVEKERRERDPRFFVQIFFPLFLSSSCSSFSSDERKEQDICLFSKWANFFCLFSHSPSPFPFFLSFFLPMFVCLHPSFLFPPFCCTNKQQKGTTQHLFFTTDGRRRESSPDNHEWRLISPWKERQWKKSFVLSSPSFLCMKHGDFCWKRN